MGAAEKIEFESAEEQTAPHARLEKPYEYGYDIFWITLAAELVVLVAAYYKHTWIPTYLLFSIHASAPLLALAVARSLKTGLRFFAQITAILPGLVLLLLGVVSAVLAFKGGPFGIKALWTMAKMGAMTWMGLQMAAVPFFFGVLGLKFAVLFYRRKSAK